MQPLSLSFCKYLQQSWSLSPLHSLVNTTKELIRIYNFHFYSAIDFLSRTWISAFSHSLVSIWDSKTRRAITVLTVIFLGTVIGADLIILSLPLYSWLASYFSSCSKISFFPKASISSSHQFQKRPQRKVHTIFQFSRLYILHKCKCTILATLSCLRLYSFCVIFFHILTKWCSFLSFSRHILQRWWLCCQYGA